MMARYIDAEKADSATIHTSYMGYSSKADVVAWLDSQPTADVVEVKHGQWLDNIENISTVAGVTKDLAVGYKCSVCGRTELRKEPYCNCGAMMK